MKRIHGHLSEQIRQRAIRNFVEPARLQGNRRFTIPVRALIDELEAEGFPKHHQAQFCSALRRTRFLEEAGLEIEKTEGPKSLTSTTVVFHYRLLDEYSAPASKEEVAVVESPPERAKRLTESLRGLLKDELVEYGGAEGFIRWVRSED